MSVEVAVDGHWDPKIERLIGKAARHAALPRITADKGAMAPPRWMSRRDLTCLVSQLHHAEAATGAACATLSRRLAGTQAGRFLNLQEIDEARHASLYREYLDMLGDIAPMDESLAAAMSGGLAWEGTPVGTVVAFNVVLESEAVNLQHMSARALSCPLFRRISERVAVDEARHVAFGNLYLRRALKTIGRDERAEIYRWVRSLWARAAAPPVSGRGMSALVLRLARRRYMDERWPVQRRHLARIGLVRDGERFPDDP